MKQTVFLVLCSVLVAAPAWANGFDDWAAVVVAGDSFAHSGKRSAVFDNGRSEIARELVTIGFRPDNIRQLSDRPRKYPDGHPVRSTLRNLARGLQSVADKTRGGCLVYLTSHGDEKGVGVGDDLLSPRGLAGILAGACSRRPAVVIVSACYSGVFVDKLKAPDRIVLTAAAKDRSSFGCGETDKYTYFDTCAVENLTAAGDFVRFGKRAIACVAGREKTEEVDLPSNPQLAVGDHAAAVIPRWGP
jgi:hypothetical protein